MKLRPAVLSNLPLLQSWDAKQHVIAAGGDDDTFDWEYELPRQVGWRAMLIGEADGRPVGIIQIIDPALEETHYWGEIEPNLRAIDIWIGDEADLGRGYGSEMMYLALDFCFADPAVNAVLIDPLASNTRAHRFYERLGFVCVDRRMFELDDCLVYRLDRAAWFTRKPPQ
jgi:aminoglycoside 6'-N-acetyltransferase